MRSNQYRSIWRSLFHVPRNPRSTRVARFSSPTQEPEPPSEKVTEIANELSTLTLLQVSDLTELLRNKLGTEAMAGMQFMGGGGGGVAAAPNNEPKEKTPNA